MASPRPHSETSIPFYDPNYIIHKTRGRALPANSIVSEARASLTRPSRPFTPAIPSRSLFGSLNDDLAYNDETHNVVKRKPRPPPSTTTRPTGLLPRRLKPLIPTKSLTPTNPEPPNQPRAETRPTRPISGSSTISTNSTDPNETISVMNSELFSLSSDWTDAYAEVDAGCKNPIIRDQDSMTTILNTDANESEEEEEFNPIWTELTTLLSSLPHSSDENDVIIRISQLRDLVDHYLAEFESKRDNEIEKREYILDVLLNWMDETGDANIAIGASGVLLKVARDDRMLLTTCKLLFKLSKSERNDGFFRAHKVFDSLISFILSRIPSNQPHPQPTPTEWLTNTTIDTIILATGTLKNVANDPQNQTPLLTYGCLDVLMELFDTILITPVPPNQALKKSTQLLIQITSALRNLSCHSSMRSKLVSSGVIERCLKCLDEGFGMSDVEEVVLNVTRVLSKLSLYPECRTRMSSEFHVGNLVKALLAFAEKKPLVLRLAFVLGNLTVEVGMEYECLGKRVGEIVGVLDAMISEWRDVEEKKDVEDVIIKLTRLVANLSIHATHGPKIVSSPQLESLITLTIDLSPRLFTTPSTHDEELLLNLIGAIANFSFYTNTNETILTPYSEKLVKTFIPLLLSPTTHPEILTETCRVIANFASQQPIQQLLVRNRGIEIMLLLMDHSDLEVVGCVMGVLMNLVISGDEQRVSFMDAGGVEKTIELVCSTVREQRWELAILGCKLLCNLRALEVDYVFSEDQCGKITEALRPVLDDSDENLTNEYEEFQDVAFNLLEITHSM